MIFLVLLQDSEPGYRASDTSSVDEDKETSRRELERRAWEALQAARVSTNHISFLHELNMILIHLMLNMK